MQDGSESFMKENLAREEDQNWLSDMTYSQVAAWLHDLGVNENSINVSFFSVICMHVCMYACKDVIKTP
jgi:hypothetical protein